MAGPTWVEVGVTDTLDVSQGDTLDVSQGRRQLSRDNMMSLHVYCIGVRYKYPACWTEEIDPIC
jgi:hypothetical protein